MYRTLRLCLLTATLLVAACDTTARLPEYELSGGALGTTFNVLLVAPGDNFSREKLQTAIRATLQDVDRLA